MSARPLNLRNGSSAARPAAKASPAKSAKSGTKASTARPGTAAKKAPAKATKGKPTKATSKAAGQKAGAKASAKSSGSKVSKATKLNKKPSTVIKRPLRRPSVDLKTVDLDEEINQEIQKTEMTQKIIEQKAPPQTATVSIDIPNINPNDYKQCYPHPFIPVLSLCPPPPSNFAVILNTLPF